MRRVSGSIEVQFHPLRDEFLALLGIGIVDNDSCANLDLVLPGDTPDVEIAFADIDDQGFEPPRFDTKLFDLPVVVRRARRY